MSEEINKLKDEVQDILVGKVLFDTEKEKEEAVNELLKKIEELEN